MSRARWVESARDGDDPHPPAAPPDLDAEAEVDLGRYGRALLERWWLLLLGLVVGAIIGYLTTLGGARTTARRRSRTWGSRSAPDGARCRR